MDVPWRGADEAFILITAIHRLPLFLVSCQKKRGSLSLLVRESCAEPDESLVEP